VYFQRSFVSYEVTITSLLLIHRQEPHRLFTTKFDLIFVARAEFQHGGVYLADQKVAIVLVRMEAGALISPRHINSIQ